MDWDLYLGLASRGASFRYVPYPVGAFREHADQASAQPGTPETRDVRAASSHPVRALVPKGGKGAARSPQACGRVVRRQRRAKMFQGLDFDGSRIKSGAENFPSSLGSVLRRPACRRASDMKAARLGITPDRDDDMRSWGRRVGGSPAHTRVSCERLSWSTMPLPVGTAEHGGLRPRHTELSCAG